MLPHLCTNRTTASLHTGKPTKAPVSFGVTPPPRKNPSTQNVYVFKKGVIQEFIDLLRSLWHRFCQWLKQLDLYPEVQKRNKDSWKTIYPEETPDTTIPLLAEEPALAEPSFSPQQVLPPQSIREVSQRIQRKIEQGIKTQTIVQLESSHIIPKTWEDSRLYRNASNDILYDIAPLSYTNGDGFQVIRRNFDDRERMITYVAYVPKRYYPSDPSDKVFIQKRTYNPYGTPTIQEIVLTLHTGEIISYCQLDDFGRFNSFSLNAGSERLEQAKMILSQELKTDGVL